MYGESLVTTSAINDICLRTLDTIINRFHWYCHSPGESDSTMVCAKSLVGVGPSCIQPYHTIHSIHTQSIQLYWLVGMMQWQCMMQLELETMIGLYCSGLSCRLGTHRWELVKLESKLLTFCIHAPCKQRYIPPW